MSSFVKTPFCFFFFFQAEDGIRDLTVTGVQTCALPICAERQSRVLEDVALHVGAGESVARDRRRVLGRSEERREGKSVDLGGRRIIKKKKKTDNWMSEIRVYATYR